MSTIEEVKQKLDIVELAGQYTRLTKAGKNFKGACPFHQEKHGSFFVFPDRQTWHCFGACSTGGDIFTLVMKREGLDFPEALKMLAGRAGIALPERGSDRRQKQKNARLYEANLAAETYYYETLVKAPEAEKARNYIKARGLNAASLTDFRLGFSPSSRQSLKNHLVERGFEEKELLDAGLVIETETGMIDRFRNRLMFPIHDHRGATTGFGGREMDGSQPKYLNSPETAIFDKSGTLYGLFLAHDEIRQKNQVIMVEGYMDAIIARQYGFNNVVAVMGTAISEKQIALVKKLTANVVLAMDADEAGEKAMLRAIEYENFLGSEVRVGIMPAGKDPDQVIQNNSGQWQAIINNTEPLMDFAISTASAGVDVTTAAGKSDLVEKTLPVIARMQNPVRQAHYLQKLARIVKVSESKLEASLIESGQTRQARPHENKLGRQPGARKIFSNPREEYCLAILIKYPELIHHAGSLRIEYFHNSENAAIFELLRSGLISTARQQLDDLSLEHMQHIEQIADKKVMPQDIQQKLYDCILLLEENHLRSLQEYYEAALSQNELAQKDRDEVLDQSLEVSRQLKEVFIKKGKAKQLNKRESASNDTR